MAKQVNGPQNKEQLKLMVDVVKREVNLAQDLLNSYQMDLIELESNSTMSDNEKISKRAFLETAIKESEELLAIRQKQLKAIDPMRGGKKASDARRSTWNDTTLESKGMNAIIDEMSRANKEQKHNETVEQTRQERQARSEAVRNAAATDTTKLAEENIVDGNNQFIVIKRPDFIPESDKWTLINKTKTGNTFIFEDSYSNKYAYFPTIGEVRKSENVGRKTLETYYDKNTNTWNQIPNEALQDSSLHYNSYTGKWMPYDFERREFEESNWQIPTYDENGKLIFDDKGHMVFKEVSEKEYEDFLNNGEKTEAERAAFAEKIKNNVMAQEDAEQRHEDRNIEMNPKEIGELALEEQKAKFRGLGPSRSDIILQNSNEPKQIKLNWFQKLKLWFMRLFNKNYQLPEARNNEFYLSDEIKKYKEGVIQENLKIEELKEQEKEEKRKIKGFSIPKVKQFFKDHKNHILALSAVAVASLALVIGINGQKEHNRQIIEQKAAEAQKEADAEAKRAQEEQQALEEAAKKQEQEKLENEQDKLVAHDAETLTSGTLTKQYFAKGGLEYTADSTGRGAKGTLAQDTIVEIFNRAIVKENEDGTKNILLTSNGKTWEDYAKDSGMSIDEIKNMLKQDKTYEMAAIQVGETNHNIFNTYGWVKTSDLDESSKGTENLKGFEITTGDNTEILQQLQQNEKANQNQQEER